MKSVVYLVLCVNSLFSVMSHAIEVCPENLKPTNYKNLGLPIHWDRHGREAWSKNWVNVQVTVLKTGKTKDAIVIDSSSRIMHAVAKRAAYKLSFPIVEKECFKEINYSYQWVLNEEL